LVGECEVRRAAVIDPSVIKDRSYTTNPISLVTGEANVPYRTPDRSLRQKRDTKPFTVIDKGQKIYNNRHVYLLRCECGRELHLDADETLLRMRRQIGCLHYDCIHSQVPYLLMHHARFSWWFQFGQLYLHQSRHLDVSWGRVLTTSPFPDRLPAIRAWKNFLGDMEAMFDPNKPGNLWVTHAINDMPIGYYSVRLEPEPNIPLLRAGKLALFDGVTFVPVKEVFKDGAADLGELYDTLLLTYFQHAVTEQSHE
jgi:hypothetical protein